MDDLSDAEVLEALERLGSRAVAAALPSVTLQVPADDWDRNFLACAFGEPGALRKAVEAHPNWFPDIGFPLWDSELLDVVADVGNFGDDAFLFHWMQMQDPLRLAKLSSAYLTMVSGKPTAWRLPPEPMVQKGEPKLVRATAVMFLRNNMDEACEKHGLAPSETHDLAALQTILSTGSRLVMHSFDYVYSKVKRGVHLASISDGTDIVSCFAGGNPIAPVYRGELQTRVAGCRGGTRPFNGRDEVPTLI